MKNIDLDELERMKEENERRMRELEEVYFGKRENAQVGKIIRDRMGVSGKDSTIDRRSTSPKAGGKTANLGHTADFERDDDSHDENDGNKRGGKRVKIVEEPVGGGDKENFAGNLEARVPKHSGVRQSGAKPPKSISRGRSGSRKEDSPVYDSPR